MSSAKTTKPKKTTKTTKIQIEELIINLVKEKRCLWDKSDEDYKDTIKKENGWVEISAMFEDMTESMVEAEWKKLKNQFQAHQRKLKKPTGSKAGQMPFFRHGRAMDFLKDAQDNDIPPFSNVNLSEADESSNNATDIDGELPQNDKEGEEEEATIVPSYNIHISRPLLSYFIKLIC